ncbi:MAG: hypothetical protein ACI9OD_004109 [Limisphaerales bacterium]|jgi:hypothetical protein
MKKIETDARLFEHPPTHVDQPFNAREKMNKFAELKTGRFIWLRKYACQEPLQISALRTQA